MCMLRVMSARRPHVCVVCKRCACNMLTECMQYANGVANGIMIEHGACSHNVRMQHVTMLSV